MYCSCLPRESEKKMSGTTSHSKRYRRSLRSAELLGASFDRRFDRATIDHGKVPANRTGRKNQTGSVRRSSSVVIRAQVSVTTT